MKSSYLSCGIASGSPPDSFLYSESGKSDTNVYLDSFETSVVDEAAKLL